MNPDIRNIFEEFTNHLEIDDLTPEFLNITSEEVLGRLLPLKGSCEGETTKYIDMVKEMRTE